MGVGGATARHLLLHHIEIWLQLPFNYLLHPSSGAVHCTGQLEQMEGSQELELHLLGLLAEAYHPPTQSGMEGAGAGEEHNNPTVLSQSAASGAATADWVLLCPPRLLSHREKLQMEHCRAGTNWASSAVCVPHLPLSPPTGS